MQRFPQSWALCASFLFLASLALWAPAQARADAQASVRGGMGFGKRNSDREDEFIVALSGHSDLMFGPPRHGGFRFGPAFEGRTVDFASLEIGGGFTLLMPIPWDFSFGLTGMAGYAHRRENVDGMMGIGTVTLGYRGYNYHDDFYAYGLNLYFSGRKHLAGGGDLVEWTGGVEVDLVFLTVIPYMALRNFFTKGDPHED